ncbi:MAG: hypothetical protein B7Z55_02030 [Planctomycetales bacterium 12-60-4]|nr:MAG: hypothetical protein B7Z55_02030 [Planctomycetales bacterium 12-60-4]
MFRAHFPFDDANQTPYELPPGHADQTGGVSLSGTVTDFAQGPLEVTNRDFDLAILGPGFFEVSDGDQQFLTRNGKLTLALDNALVTADQGFPIMDVGGQPIVIPDGISDVAVAADGMVSGVGQAGETVLLGQVGVVEPPDVALLTKEGDGLYRSPEPVAPALQAQVRQGVLEGSSTDPVHSMVDLIETSRAFEMNMNLVRYQDEMLGQLIQSVARK